MKYLFGMIGLLLAASVNAAPVGSAFTYQGQLNKEGGPVNSPQDFEFGLYDAAQSGAQIGTTVTVAASPVVKGLFTVQLDFGPQAFGADARFLQIQVKPADQDTYASLSPRVRITPAPVALTALTAGSAAVADSVVPWAIGSASLQDGAVQGSHLAPDVFAVHHAVMTSDQYVDWLPEDLIFDKVVQTSPAFSYSHDRIMVQYGGLYRIDASAAAFLQPTDSIKYSITVNGVPKASFSERAQGISSHSRVTALHYALLGPYDEVSMQVSGQSFSHTLECSGTDDNTYISIMKVK